MMSVGERLRSLRGEKTQEEVAKDLGVTKSSYAMYERDERTPRDEVKVKIARYYGLRVGQLFFAE